MLSLNDVLLFDASVHVHTRLSPRYFHATFCPTFWMPCRSMTAFPSPSLPPSPFLPFSLFSLPSPSSAFSLFLSSSLFLFLLSLSLVCLFSLLSALLPFPLFAVLPSPLLSFAPLLFFCCPPFRLLLLSLLPFLRLLPPLPIRLWGLLGVGLFVPRLCCPP